MNGEGHGGRHQPSLFAGGLELRFVGAPNIRIHVNRGGGERVIEMERARFIFYRIHSKTGEAGRRVRFENFLMRYSNCSTYCTTSFVWSRNRSYQVQEYYRTSIFSHHTIFCVACFVCTLLSPQFLYSVDSQCMISRAETL